MPEAIIAYDRSPLVAAEHEWREALSSWRDYPCETLEEEDQWSEALREAQSKLKEIDDQRKTLALPIDRELKALNKDFKAYMQPLDAFKMLATKVLSAARMRRDAAEKVAKRLLAEAAESGDEDATFTALAAVPDKAKVAGTRTVYKWEFEVTDESQIERRFMVFDEDLARQFAEKAYGKDTSKVIKMPGFTATCVPSVSTTGRRSP